MKTTILWAFFLLNTLNCAAQKEVDILIVGGGAGGTSAGIQAARMGVKVQILESTTWLGGMLTSAGVSAIDGNHEMPSGIWGEFRDSLYAHYGGPQEVATGWVSHTLFEPSVGNTIFRKMANISNLDIAFDSTLKEVKKNVSGWLVSYRQKDILYSVKTKILIDATETGTLLPLVGTKYRLGMDSKQETGEEEAPEIANDIVQDLTYVLILKDVGNNTDKKGLVKKPENYDPQDFQCACYREENEMHGSVTDCLQMLDYGKLPNNKYMINWPNCGNDFFLDWPRLSLREKNEKLKEAKAHSQGFVYYIQNELGFRNLRITHEFPSRDSFPMIPYHREARRVKGKVFLTADHLRYPFDFDLYRTGIAVGDYPIDHHHDKNPTAPKINFINIKIPSYNIPLGCLIPRNTENLIVAEKNISVSNIVNGTTRLQPVVLGIGQAAGTLAAIAILEGKKPSDIPIRKVQETLLKAKGYIMPYIDVKTSDPAFESIQRIGACGILKGIGVPYKWANQTWFYPNRIVSEFEFKQGLLPYYENLRNFQASGKGITLNLFYEVTQKINPGLSIIDMEKNWDSWDVQQAFNKDIPLNRRTVSILIDNILNPFALEIDYNGTIVKDVIKN